MQPMLSQAAKPAVAARVTGQPVTWGVAEEAAERILVAGRWIYAGRYQPVTIPRMRTWSSPAPKTSACW